MPSFLLENSISLILGLTTVIATLFYLREYNLRKKLSQQGEKMLQEFKEKGLETLHQSIQKSQDIIGSAKEEEVKIEEQYSATMADITKQAEANITQAQAQLLQFMADLQKRSQDFELAAHRATQERINQMFERLETRLSEFLVTTEQKTISSIELELKASRQLIETYKAQQLALIDENILAMMEQTLNLVLGKKLSLQDQLDLIYEALEKAKVEKFIV